MTLLGQMSFHVQLNLIGKKVQGSLEEISFEEEL